MLLVPCWGCRERARYAQPRPPPTLPVPPASRSIAAAVEATAIHKSPNEAHLAGDVEHEVNHDGELEHRRHSTREVEQDVAVDGIAERQIPGQPHGVAEAASGADGPGRHGAPRPVRAGATREFRFFIFVAFRDWVCFSRLEKTWMLVRSISMFPALCLFTLVVEERKMKTHRRSSP